MTAEDKIDQIAAFVEATVAYFAAQAEVPSLDVLQAYIVKSVENSEGEHCISAEIIGVLARRIREKIIQRRKENDERDLSMLAAVFPADMPAVSQPRPADYVESEHTALPAPLPGLNDESVEARLEERVEELEFELRLLVSPAAAPAPLLSLTTVPQGLQLLADEGEGPDDEPTVVEGHEVVFGRFAVAAPSPPPAVEQQVQAEPEPLPAPPPVIDNQADAWIAEGDQLATDGVVHQDEPPLPFIAARKRPQRSRVALGVVVALTVLAFLWGASRMLPSASPAPAAAASRHEEAPAVVPQPPAAALDPVTPTTVEPVPARRAAAPLARPPATKASRTPHRRRRCATTADSAEPSPCHCKRHCHCKRCPTHSMGEEGGGGELAETSGDPPLDKDF